MDVDNILDRTLESVMPLIRDEMEDWVKWARDFYKEMDLEAGEMKICTECGQEVYQPEFDGENGWICDDCTAKLVNRFHEIFGVHLCAYDGSGRVIELVELKRVLELIKPSMSMQRYVVDLRDLREAEDVTHSSISGQR